jgi:hypothetical protein
MTVNQPCCDVPVRELLQVEGMPQQAASDLDRAAGEIYIGYPIPADLVTGDRVHGGQGDGQAPERSGSVV